MSDPRQAPEHIKPPNFRNAVKVLLLHIYIVALSLGVGCKHLLHWLSNHCPDIDTLNPVAQARVVLSPA